MREIRLVCRGITGRITQLEAGLQELVVVGMLHVANLLLHLGEHKLGLCHANQALHIDVDRALLILVPELLTCGSPITRPQGLPVRGGRGGQLHGLGCKQHIF